MTSSSVVRAPDAAPGSGVRGRRSTEHQQPERSLRRFKAGMRRHIEAELTILGRIVRREWWWEPDREPCDPLARRVSR